MLIELKTGVYVEPGDVIAVVQNGRDAEVHLSNGATIKVNMGYDNGWTNVDAVVKTLRREPNQS